MEIVWDEPKRLANLDKHGLDFARLTETFFENAIVVPARDKRWFGIGLDSDGVLAVVFAKLAARASASSACARRMPGKGSSMPKASKRKPYSALDMKDVSDNPEWTKETFAKAKPFREAFPDLAATIRRRGAQKAPVKKAISIRLDVDVLNSYRKTGDGWQSRINDDLRKARKLA